MNDLKNVIHIGKQNAIHQKELANRLGVTPATAKYMVRKARQNGLQILSGVNGYWIAENDIEKREFIALMRKQAFSRLKSTKSINSTLNDSNGQMSLSDALTAISERS